MRFSGYLTPEGEARAREVAHQRQWENEAAGRRDRVPGTTQQFEQHLGGARAECFVSEVYDVPWEPQPWGRRDRPDVGLVDVRWSRNHGLFIYAENPDDRGIAFVSGRMDGWLRVYGWRYGWEGKVDEFWNRRLRLPTWEVPRDRLADPATLPIKQEALW